MNTSNKLECPKNIWYVACTPDEIEGGPLGRVICGESLVLFRTDKNEVAALEDFCPHRGAQLSLGTVQDGLVVCGYHGMKINADGKCAAMVGQTVEKFRKGIRSYPAVERHGYVWVWPGEASLANADLIPDLHWARSPDWAFGGGMFNIRCDYRLLIDNLMDLTHETYVHATSIGQPEIEEAAPDTARDGHCATVSRRMENIPAPPFWQDALKGNNLDPDVPVDRWQICRFTPPGSVMIDVGVAHAGHGGLDAPAEHRASGIVVDLITPETETSCWYFWGLARNFNVSDSVLTTTIRDSQQKIFTEDLEMLESQQRNLDANPDRRLMSLNIDRGGAHARKILQELIATDSDSA
ncbi:MAG: aromatic ring-hydroxylating dioxygenase subunit alpha [Gammaproteobacteria bacterium]|nr:aromatic ring-hydroxylating dioxygenase subunit alpha [Gammaproteobacteria bacterium]